MVLFHCNYCSAIVSLKQMQCNCFILTTAVQLLGIWWSLDDGKEPQPISRVFLYQVITTINIMPMLDHPQPSPARLCVCVFFRKCISGNVLPEVYFPEVYFFQSVFFQSLFFQSEFYQRVISWSLFSKSIFSQSVFPQHVFLVWWGGVESSYWHRSFGAKHITFTFQNWLYPIKK